MKKMMMCLVVALFATTLTAQAQDKDDLAAKQKEMNERRAQQLVKQLKLDDATADWFKPLYAEYQEKLHATRRGDRPTADAKEKKQELTDEQILEQIRQNFDNEEKAIALKRTYFQEFSAKLTARQLQKVFQDNGGRADGNRQQNRQNNRQGGFSDGGPGGFGGGFGGGDF